MRRFPHGASQGVQNAFTELSDDLRGVSERLRLMEREVGGISVSEQDLEGVRKDITRAARPKPPEWDDVFRASGPGHSIGHVPDPGSAAGTGRFLREDAAWSDEFEAIKLADGAEALPSLAFEQDPDTGLWRPGANRLQLSTAGAGRWEIDASGHLVPVDNNTYKIGQVTQPRIIKEIIATKFNGIAINGVGFSSGQDNGATTGADVLFDSYDAIIPAGLLSQPGDMILVENVYYGLAAAAATRTAKLQIDATGLKTIFVCTAALAWMTFPTHLGIRYRTSTTGAITGITLINAQGATAVGADYHVNLGFAGLDWTAEQTLHFYGRSTVASSIGITDQTISCFPVISGALV